MVLSNNSGSDQDLETPSNDTIRHIKTQAWNKPALRAELALDVEQWLAKGNVIASSQDRDVEPVDNRGTADVGGYYV